ncbi:MAG: aspartate aminotransferase family protein [Chloroflexi bacterium]|nr:aspartate aminotransferase family protein [Chloroflexota bacterium]
MSMQGKKTHEIFEKALKYIPHGVNSNFRYWGDDDTLVIKRGQGAYIWDMDDKRYIDYRLAFGPIILGHAYPAVTERVQQAIEGGTLFAWTTPLEVSVAERICRMTGVDKVRITNTGSEATFHALRIARAYTGREKFVKFEGQYHGMIDYFMFGTASSKESNLGPRDDPRSDPMSLGIPKGISEYVLNLPFNDFEILEKTLAKQGEEIAAVFVEPMLGNVASIMPKPGFLEKIRELCDRYGIVLVFDEVKTGFRIANGGAQEHFGVRADLATYAKSLGNGFPIAAFGGKEEIMMTIQPGKTAHGGTYSGNTAGVAAADATLEILENEPVIETVNARGRALMDGIGEILSEHSIPHVVTGLPAMFGILLGSDEEPREFREYLRSDMDLYEEIGMELIARGIQPDADGREPWFVCYALSEEDVAETLTAFNDAVKAAKK